MPNIILPGGDKKYISADQTVNNILLELGEKNSIESYVLFSGKKLPLESKLNEVEFLNDDTNVYLVNRSSKKIEPEKTMYVDKLRRLLKIIGHRFRRNDYKKVKEYISNSENLSKILKEHPALYNDQIGFDALCDFRLLVDHLATNPTFYEEHPHCVNIFKEIVETQLSNRKTTPLDHLNEMDEQYPGVSNQVFQQPRLSNSGVITSQMLAQALNPTLLAPIQPQTDPRQLYAEQLKQMAEFGFVDEAANLEAIQVCDGNVERALEYLVTHIEQMEQ